MMVCGRDFAPDFTGYTMKNYKTLKCSKILPLLVAYVERHENFKGSFFWSAPSNAAGRRQLEKENELEFSFTLQGVVYSFNQWVSCSCSNVYYSSQISVNGAQKNIRAAKSLIKKFS